MEVHMSLDKKVDKKEILGQEVEISEINNPTLKSIFSSEIENKKIMWNPWYADGDSYIDCGDGNSS